MEWVTKGLGLRNRSLKPIKIPVRSPTGSFGNHDDYEEEPVSPSSLLFHEPNFNIYNIAIMGGRNGFDADLAFEKLPHTLLKHPRFTCIQVVDDKDGGKMKWVPTNVNLHNHIIIPTIPQNLTSPDKFLEDYIYNLSKSSIDSSKPMWEFHLLNLKTSHAEAIGIFRIHHSLGDGISLMSLLLACGRQVSNPEAVPTIPTKKGSNKGWLSTYSNSFDIGGTMWHRFFMTIYMVCMLVWNTLVDVLYVIVTALFLTDTETPLKASEGSEFTPRRFAYRIVSLDDMKLIKNALNTTINDVALGVTQAALSQYLNRRYCEGKKDKGATEKNNNLPKNIRLRSSLLINIRPSSGIQALADMMEKDSEAKWGNWIGFVLLPFTIGIRDDPLDYVREAKKTIDRKKHSLEVLFTFSIVELVLKLFGVKTASKLSHEVITRTTLVFSNLVGPLEEICAYGHELGFLAGSSYGQPQGLMINLQSYVNKMTIILSVDENNVPDPHKLLDDFEESLKLIKEAVYAKGLVK